MNFFQPFVRWVTLILAFSATNFGHVAASSYEGGDEMIWTSHEQKQGVLQPLASTFDIPYIDFEDWDPNNKQDQARIARLKNGFKDAMALAWYADKGCFGDLTIFRRYFGNDQKSVRPSKVFQIFQNIHGTLNTDENLGNDMLSNIKIRKTVKVGDEAKNKCTSNADSTLAFMVYKGLETTPGSGIYTYTAYIVLCEDFWELPDFHYSEEMCKHVGNTANEKMDNLGRGLLHEILHFPEVSQGFWKKLIDVQVDPKDKDACYGPENTQWLAKKYPENAGVNSDNYVWVAEESRWLSLCKKEFDPIDTSQNTCRIA